MEVQTAYGKMSRRRVEHILDTIHSEPKFNEWREKPEEFREELNRLFDLAGIRIEQWAGFVTDYAHWVSEGKRLADWVVAYGVLPDTSATTQFLLSLVTPYAHALRARQAFEAGAAMAGNVSPAILSTYPGDPTESLVIARLRSMMR